MELNEIDWEHMFEEDGFDIFKDVSTSLEEENTGTAINTVDSWIEELLMNGDEEAGVGVELGNDFMWSDLLLDSPLEDRQPSDERESLEDKSSPSCSNSEVNVKITSNYTNDNSGEDIPNFESNNKSEDDVLELHDTDSDPLSKKRKRQLRNRDAAMRSRERKKIYVKDLEMKSRYMEAECRRLGRLLQCCYAENQMLRISLGSAYGASVAKPESAVLLLESLLLVSLVWLMVNMCLLPLPKMPLLSQDAVPQGNGERKELESAATNGKRTKVTELWLTYSFMKSKRCRGSRIKMKSVIDRGLLSI